MKRKIDEPGENRIDELGIIRNKRTGWPILIPAHPESEYIARTNKVMDKLEKILTIRGEYYI